MVQKHDIDDVFSIVSQALEFEDDSARRDYLDNACSQAPEIRLEVDRLLQAHDNAGSFLQTNPISNDPTSCSLGPGSIVGPYKLIERIGEGGMGVVYMAEQVDLVRRTVAVKILKLGLDTEQVVARFAAERQAMAMMSHPHIAKVFDAGTTDSGRPYRHPQRHLFTGRGVVRAIIRYDTI